MKKRILVIEDEINIKETIADILELKGYNVSTAENGQAGFFSIIKENPDLILCDIMMPKMNGFEVLEAVRSYMKTRTIPFVFLTAKDEQEAFRNGMDLGADDFLVKPVNSQKLQDVIESRLEKHRILLETGQRVENKRVSKDLHDTLQQTLLGLNMQINKTVELASTDLMRTETSKSLEYVKIAISQLRLILESREEDTGEDLFLRVKQMAERLLGYVDFQINLQSSLTEKITGIFADEAFKVLQEVINNTIKHARARNLNISFNQVDSHIEIQLQDDGVGFDEDKISHKRGLCNINERMAKIGGKVTICSALGQGTLIMLEFDA